MNWRDPEKELPKQGQKVWAMTEPHKYRGSILESAMSIEIVCGEVSYSNDGLDCRVENGDELGLGNISWYLKRDENKGYDVAYAFAWLPIDEMDLPGWRN